MNTSLNMASLAGINEFLELLSWPASESCKCVYSSRFSTAIAQPMIKLEMQELNLEEKDRGLLTSPTYAAFVEIIHDTLINRHSTDNIPYFNRNPVRPVRPTVTGLRSLNTDLSLLSFLEIHISSRSYPIHQLIDRN